jgi:hypothetical protein
MNRESRQYNGHRKNQGGGHQVRTVLYTQSSAPTLRINSPVYITKAINDDVLSFF